MEEGNHSNRSKILPFCTQNDQNYYGVLAVLNATSLRVDPLEKGGKRKMIKFLLLKLYPSFTLKGQFTAVDRKE